MTIRAVIDLATIPKTDHTRELLVRVLTLLSDVLNSINNDYTALVHDIRTVEDGVEFVDGNGNVVYKIPAMA